MNSRRRYNPAHKDEVFDTLRREILAARLRVTLDEQLNRETPVEVKKLSRMKLPPIVRPSTEAGVVFRGEDFRIVPVNESAQERHEAAS